MTEPSASGFPTAYADLNAVLREMVARQRALLGGALVGVYLQGSFASGGYDRYSDVDWVAVTRRDLDDGEVARLQAMHARLYGLESGWAQHLEGSYFPAEVLRPWARAGEPLWYLDNGATTLERSAHDNSVVVRWVLREDGVALCGPAAATLIDPIPREALSAEVRATMREWGATLLADPAAMDNRWYQPFAVLSYCRMLQTLATGRVGSKPEAARWAAEALDGRWAGLIARAWGERTDQYRKVRQKADPGDLGLTAEFIRYALGEGLRLVDGGG